MNWAGIFPKSTKGGTIVAVDEKGVQLFRYKNDNKMWKAWSSFTVNFERQPQPGDLIIYENGEGFSVGKALGDDLGEDLGQYEVVAMGIATVWQARASATAYCANRDLAVPDVWLRLEAGKYRLLDMNE